MPSAWLSLCMISYGPYHMVLKIWTIPIQKDKNLHWGWISSIEKLFLLSSSKISPTSSTGSWRLILSWHRIPAKYLLLPWNLFPRKTCSSGEGMNGWEEGLIGNKRDKKVEGMIKVGTYLKQRLSQWETRLIHIQMISQIHDLRPIDCCTTFHKPKKRHLSNQPHLNVKQGMNFI